MYVRRKAMGNRFGQGEVGSLRERAFSVAVFLPIESGLMCEGSSSAHCEENLDFERELQPAM